MDLDVMGGMTYPIGWQLEGKRALVVGGGNIAARKTASLLESGAAVTVVAPDIRDELRRMAEGGFVTVRGREYASADMQEGWSLAFAATDSAEVNGRVVQDARAVRVPVCSVSDPESGDFIVPSVLRRGRLTIAVSTSGASPGTAVRIRDELEERFGPEYETYLDFLYTYRLKVQEIVKDTNRRRQLLRHVLELDLLSAIRSGDFAHPEERLWLELEAERERK